MSRQMGILFVINTLEPGGAEIFILRLAKYLRQHFRCYVVTAIRDRNDAAFTAHFLRESGATLLPGYDGLSVPRAYCYWKLNALLGRLGIGQVFERLALRHRHHYWKRLVARHNIRLVNSHLFASDLFVLKEIKAAIPSLPWVITMHSSYNAEVYEKYTPSVYERFCEQVMAIFSTADRALCVAERNKELLVRLGLGEKVEKVYLGIESSGTITSKTSDVFLDPMVFAMIGRGFKGKGWHIALKAFESVKQRHPHVQLLCIGPETAYMSSLKDAFAHVPDVLFTGYVNDTAPYIAKAHVGLLPSHGESLPYSIIEFLAQGRPVIASDRGEISLMLTAASGIAGAVLRDDADGLPSVDALTEKMEAYIKDRRLLQEHMHLASTAFQKFSMEHCGGHYREVFNVLIHGAK